MNYSYIFYIILGIIPMLIIIGFIISKCFIKINLFNKDSFNNNSKKDNFSNKSLDINNNRIIININLIYIIKILFYHRS